MESAAEDTSGNEIPHVPDIRDCRCGCVPPDLMSLFQMAELRAKYRQKMKQEAANAAQSVLSTSAADVN